jgi:hypothetical protein
LSRQLLVASCRDLILADWSCARTAIRISSQRPRSVSILRSRPRRWRSCCGRTSRSFDVSSNCIGVRNGMDAPPLLATFVSLTLRRSGICGPVSPNTSLVAGLNAVVLVPVAERSEADRRIGVRITSQCRADRGWRLASEAGDMSGTRSGPRVRQTTRGPIRPWGRSSAGSRPRPRLYSPDVTTDAQLINGRCRTLRNDPGPIVRAGVVSLGEHADGGLGVTRRGGKAVTPACRNMESGRREATPATGKRRDQSRQTTRFTQVERDKNAVSVSLHKTTPTRYAGPGSSCLAKARQGKGWEADVPRHSVDAEPPRQGDRWMPCRPRWRTGILVSAFVGTWLTRLVPTHPAGPRRGPAGGFVLPGPPRPRPTPRPSSGL